MRILFSVILFIPLLIACSNRQNADSSSIKIAAYISSPQTYTATNIHGFFKQALQLHKSEIKHIYKDDFTKAASRVVR